MRGGPNQSANKSGFLGIESQLPNDEVLKDLGTFRSTTSIPGILPHESIKEDVQVVEEEWFEDIVAEDIGHLLESLQTFPLISGNEKR